MSIRSSKVTTLRALKEEGRLLEWQDNFSLCYGLFNLIHPGHLRYFQTAKQYGSRLVVALRGDSMLSEVQRRECFAETERARAVAALELIDNVIILDSGGLEDLVSLTKPKTLILGTEFEKERSREVGEAVNRIHDYDGRVIYEAGETHYASAHLFLGRQDEIEDGRSRQFRTALSSQAIDLSKVLLSLRKTPGPNMLVLGDTIVDRYVACDPIGMSSEAPVIVVKELESRDFLGGAGIVAAHIAALGGECTYISVTGEDVHADFVKDRLIEYQVKAKLFVDKSRPTTRKIRYMVENQKLFRVSRLKEHRLPRDVEDLIVEKILELAPCLNSIVVADFVYGVITPRILEILQVVSKDYDIQLYGDLQCSSQVGNIAKFRNFKLLCPTEREARIALNNQDDGVEYVANLLMTETSSSNLVLKLGGDGFIAYSRDINNNFVYRQHFPALTINPVDVAGAGDSLLAGVSVGLAQGLSLMEASALGCCVAALAVQSVGNNPVNYQAVRTFIEQQELDSNAI